MNIRHRNPARARGGRGAAGRRGQSVTEFALILPLTLTLVGATVDFARLFQGWITLQAATRDAAEYASTNTTTTSDAQTEAQRVVCLQTKNLGGFQAGGSPPNDETCTSPAVSIVSYTWSDSVAPATDRHPVASVTVRSTLPFSTLFPYPFLNQGAWTLSSTQSYTVIQNRT